MRSKNLLSIENKKEMNLDRSASFEDQYRLFFTPSQVIQKTDFFEQASLFDYSEHVVSSSSTPLGTVKYA